MDGMLCFMPMGDNERIKAIWTDIANTMEKETCRIFEELGKDLTPLGTWEIKSTSAGPLEVMTSVAQLGQFVWMYCDTACTKTKRHPKELGKVVRMAVGPDARHPPWKLKVC